MQAHYAEAFEREMGCTEADWLAVLPGAEEASFDVQLQKLMQRKRDLAQNLLAAPAFTKNDYDALVAETLSARKH